MSFVKNLEWLKIKLSIKANYFAGNFKEKIWLLGDGRSGTTWVSDLINHDNYYREMFEPFHPKYVKEMQFLKCHQYVRPGCFRGELEETTGRIFSGKLSSRRVDSENKSSQYKGILIKDIFANLLCYSATQKFNDVKVVLLIRNPFSVALSKYKKKDWFWFTEPKELLEQKTLYEDYLFRFEDLILDIDARNDFILNQVLIWSIINYIPIRQFVNNDIHVCFYENFLLDPYKELQALYNYVGRKAEVDKTTLSEDIIRRPSRVTNKSSCVLSGKTHMSSWKRQLSSSQKRVSLQILKQFGFDGLYNQESLPEHKMLKNIQLNI